MKWKMTIWFLVTASLGIVSAGEGVIPKPGYLAGLHALTDKRIPMKLVAAERCSIDAILTRNPHIGADMVVHANQALIDYISKNPEGVGFPVGSILLKEKFPAGQPASTAILITRMERVAIKGAVEDWKFSASSLVNGKPTGARDAPSSCVACHEDFEESSFVSPDSLKFLREYVKNVPHK